MEAASQPARRRQAAAIFLGHRIRTRDRVVAAAYFAAAAGRWARWSVEPSHVASVEAGLDACRAPSLAVDVGTGTGAAAAVAARRFPDARRMLERARRAHRAVNLSFHRARARALPVPDGRADLVVCLNAVPDPVELRRALAARGQVLAATSTTSMGERTGEWADRWREVGFERVAAGDAGGGSWELFERQGVPGASAGQGASS